MLPKVLSFIFIVFVVFLPYAAHAQTGTNVIPGIQNTTSLEDLVKVIYEIALSAGTILAFGMIVWGALEYSLSAGNLTSKTDATDRIWSALWGLAILLGAALILNIINPKILAGGSVSSSPSPSPTPPGFVTHSPTEPGTVSPPPQYGPLQSGTSGGTINPTYFDSPPGSTSGVTPFRWYDNSLNEVRYEIVEFTGQDLLSSTPDPSGVRIVSTINGTPLDATGEMHVSLSNSQLGPAPFPGQERIFFVRSVDSSGGYHYSNPVQIAP